MNGVPAWWRSHPAWAAALVIALIALAASASGLWNGFAYDDLFMIRDNPSVQTLRDPLAYFGESYWGPARGHPSAYRPVTIWFWSLQWAAGAGSPFIFHAVNVGLYVAVSVLVLLVLRLLLAAGPAALGAAIFAAHPVHVEAVANVVGQAELTVATLLLLALWLYGRDRQRGDLRAGTMVAIVVAFAVAMFLKEHSIVLPALLVALELAGRRLGFAPVTDPWVPRLRLTVLLLGLTVALYLLVRVQVLGLVTADDPHWSLRTLSAGERATVMLALVPEFVRLLCWPARLYADYSPAHTPVLPTLSWAHLPGTITLLGLIALTVMAWRRRATLPLFAVAWFILTMALLSNLLFPIGVLIAERMLFLPSVGVAVLVAWAAAEAAEWQGLRRALAVSAALAAVLAGSVHSAIETRVWMDNPTLFSTLATRAPTNFRAPFALAEFYGLGGRFDVADTLFQRAIALDPSQVPARLTYAQELQIQGRCDRALPLLLSVRRDDPYSSAAVIGTAYCQLAAQRFSEARLTALQGLAVGMDPPLLRQARRLADSMLVVTDSADARNRFLREGLPVTKGGGPLPVTIRRFSRQELQRQWSVQRSRQAATSAGGSSPEPET